MSDLKTVLEIDRLSAVLHRRCENNGVHLRWISGVPTAMTDGKEIILPTLFSPVSQAALDKLYGFVVHECGHHTRPETFEIMKALPDETPEPLRAMFNIAEDDGMERDVGNAYRGDAIALGKQNDVVLGELSKAWQKAEYPPDVTTQQLAPIAVCGIGQLSRMSWDGVSHRNRAKYFNDMHPLAKELMEELVSEGWVDKFQGTVTPDDTWDVACDLYKRIYPEADDEAVEDLRSKGHSKEPADQSSSLASQDGDDTFGEATGDGDASGEEGKGNEIDARLPTEPQQGQVVSWKDAVMSEHNDWQAKPDGQIPGNIGIDWTDYKQGDVCLMPRHMVNVMDMRKRNECVESENDWCGIATPASFMPDNSKSRAFGNQIRRYLQSQSRTRVDRERYHGKLDKSSLTKLAMPPIDGGDWNRRLFYNFSDRQGLDTCIHVLTDWSGSMQGTKMVHAADASGRLVYVFDRVLRVPVQLAAFTNGRTTCDIGLIKTFNERSVSPTDIAERFSKFYKYSSANNDADSVMWAYNQLLPRKEKRKILIVLSDGAPAGSWEGSSHSNLKHVTKMIEDEGIVELYGVGIESSSVETYYSRNKVLNSSDQINQTLFDIIKEGAYK